MQAIAHDQLGARERHRRNGPGEERTASDGERELQTGWRIVAPRGALDRIVGERRVSKHAAGEEHQRDFWHGELTQPLPVGEAALFPVAPGDEGDGLLGPGALAIFAATAPLASNQEPQLPEDPLECMEPRVQLTPNSSPASAAAERTSGNC